MCREEEVDHQPFRFEGLAEWWELAVIQREARATHSMSTRYRKCIKIEVPLQQARSRREALFLLTRPPQNTVQQTHRQEHQNRRKRG